MDSKSQGDLTSYCRKRLNRRKQWQLNPDRSSYPVTVCIATICTLNQRQAIIGASDCMLTFENVEFETNRSKIFNLNKRTFILFAGHVTDHTTIWRNAFQGKNTDTMTTADIAENYAQAFQSLRMKQAEAAILKPQGLTFKTYISQQRKLSDYVANEYRRQLEENSLKLEVIIAGLDSTGAHIFTIQDPGLAECHDDISFCAVGIGASQSREHFMFSSYTKETTFADCMYLTYVAKRRGQFAPGVGQATIMAAITANGADMIDNRYVDFVKTTYEEASKAVSRIHEATRTKIRAEIAKMDIA